jgi:hypothetical protein
MGKLIYRSDEGIEYEIPMNNPPKPDYRTDDRLLTASIAGGYATVEIRLRADGSWEIERYMSGAFTGPEWRNAGDIMSGLSRPPLTVGQLQALQDWVEMPETAPFGVARLGYGLQIETGARPHPLSSGALEER